MTDDKRAKGEAAVLDAIDKHEASYAMGYEAGRAAERAAIVAYLREVDATHGVETPIEPAQPFGHPMYGARTVEYFETAACVERGEHVQKKEYFVTIGGIGVDARLGGRWLAIVGPNGQVAKLFVGSEDEARRAGPLVGLTMLAPRKPQPSDAFDVKPFTPFVAKVRLADT